MQYKGNSKNFSITFESSLECKTIGCHKSVRSAYHEFIEEKAVGEHPLVFSLLKEVLNQRSATKIWNV